MLFVGVDWGKRHHDLCLLDQDGRVLAARRIADGLAGAGELQALVAAHAEQPAQVAVGIETDRGLLVRTLLAAGCQVFAVNPQVVGRYRGRHQVSRAKSDRGDAKVLADLVRTDRHNHRQVAGDAMMNVPKMRRWFERLGVQDKTYRAYPGVGHGLDFAPDRAEYLADLLGWLSARVSPESPRPTGGGP
jgi:transposase